MAVALVSTAVFVAVIVLVVVRSAGWDDLKEAFFSRQEFAEAFPDILSAFWTNVKIFLIAEVFILVFALAIAVLRSLPGPDVLFHGQAIAF